MCTVSFLPLAEGGFILTSNRDEAPARSPRQLSRSASDEVPLIFPRDTAAGGTWIAAGTDRTAVLLNGAFEKHRHEPPYRRSRGLMVIDLFDYPSVPHFLQTYPFERMEPFTLVVVEADQPTEIRWDGRQRHVRSLSPRSAHFWSSATLYPEPVGQLRRQWFDQWLALHPNPSPAEVLHLHRSGGQHDPRNGFVMNRDDVVRTVSITQILKRDQTIEMHYHDLLRQERCLEKLQAPARRPLPQPEEA